MIWRGIKYCLMLPGLIIFFIYVFILGIMESHKAGGWNKKQRAKFSLMVSEYLRENIDTVEWMSLVFWAGCIIFLYEKWYAAWIF